MFFLFYSMHFHLCIYLLIVFLVIVFYFILFYNSSLVLVVAMVREKKTTRN